MLLLALLEWRNCGAPLLSDFLQRRQLSRPRSRCLEDACGWQGIQRTLSEWSFGECSDIELKSHELPSPAPPEFFYWPGAAGSSSRRISMRFEMRRIPSQLEAGPR